MNIEKTIEEKAREYVSLTAINEIYQYAYEGTITIDEAENCIEIASIESFKSGAAFALSLNRWRKVSEELPEDNKELIIQTESELTTQPVLIKTVGGRLFVDYRVKTINKNLDGWVEFWNWTRFNQVVEWKPIIQNRFNDDSPELIE